MDADGLVTAKSAGTATITASTPGAESKTCTVTVKNGGVVIRPVITGQDGQTVGNTIALKATTTPAGGTVAWRSTDTSVAEVDQNGVVTIKSAGQTDITATYETYSATYTVYGILSDGLFKLRNRGSYLYASIYGNSVMQTEEGALQASENDLDDSRKQMWHFQYVGSGRYLIRSRINPTMAIAPEIGNSGKVGTLYVGETTNAPLTAYWSITGAGNNYTIRNISTGKVLSTVTGSYSQYNKTQLLLEDDELESSVSHQRWGRITVTGDSGGIYLVRWSHPTTAMPDPTNCTLDIGDTARYVVAYYSPTDFSQDFTWTSSNTKIATVSSNGTITAVGAGTAMVTARHSSGAQTRIIIKARALEYGNYTTLLSETPYNQTAIDDIATGTAEYNSADESYKKLFLDNTAKMYGIAYSAAKVCSNTNSMDIAGQYLKHFLDGSGEKISDFPVECMLKEGENTKQYLEFIDEVDSVLEAVENLLINRSEVSFISSTERNHNDMNRDRDGDNWYCSINQYRSVIKCTATLNSNGTYTATIQYIIKDYYDRSNNAEYTINFGGLLSIASSELWRMNYMGLAKNYEVEGMATVIVGWSNGERLGGGAQYGFVE